MKIIEHIRNLKANIRSLHLDFKAGMVKRLRAKEVVRVLSVAHAQELKETPIELWNSVKQRHQERIDAVMAGKLDLIDRRSWSYPYLPECFPDNHEILTERGWISVTKIKSSDKFATRSRDGRLVYQEATKIHKQWFDGEILSFDNKLVKFSVTPNHRMFGRFKRRGYKIKDIENAKPKSIKFSKDLDDLSWKVKKEYKNSCAEVSEKLFSTAEEIEAYQLLYKGKVGKSGEYTFEVPSTTKWIGKLPPWVKDGIVELKCLHKKADRQLDRNREKCYVDFKDWIAFLGIFTAEGHAAGTGLGKDRDGRRPYWVQAIAASSTKDTLSIQNNFNVEIAQRKTSKYYNDIKSLLERLPWNFQAGKTGSFRISHTTLHSHLYQLGNTYTKRVPQWIKDLPPEYIDIFITWACKGDGWFDGNGGGRRRNYKTVSEGLANDIEELFRKVGKDTYIKYPNGQRKHKLGRFKNAPQFIVSERHSKWKGLPRPKRIQYRGYVYCVSVPNSIICVRQTSGGMAVWTGNSLHRLRSKPTNFEKHTL
jgi:hypothetical protein